MHTILFLDDDAVFLRAMQRIATSLDAQVYLATSLDDARQQLAKLPEIDVAVLDYHLPDGVGLDLVEELKAAHPLGAIILFTGSPTAELAMEALNLGIHGCLRKDVGTDQIRQMLMQTLERTRLLRERARMEAQEQTMRARLLHAASEWQRTFDSVDSPIVLVD